MFGGIVATGQQPCHQLLTAGSTRWCVWLSAEPAGCRAEGQLPTSDPRRKTSPGSALNLTCRPNNNPGGRGRGRLRRLVLGQPAVSVDDTRQSASAAGAGCSRPVWPVSSAAVDSKP